MKKSVKSILAIAAIAFAAGSANVSAANFNQTKLTNAAIELAYAPQDPIIDNRFEQFESEVDMHELNDAWLGMPVVSEDGETIGFVEDAYLDINGEVEELLISISNQKIAVYVEGKFVTLFDAEVAISLSTQTIAGLEQETEFEVVSR